VLGQQSAVLTDTFTVDYVITSVVMYSKYLHSSYTHTVVCKSFGQICRLFHQVDLSKQISTSTYKWQLK